MATIPEPEPPAHVADRGPAPLNALPSDGDCWPNNPYGMRAAEVSRLFDLLTEQFVAVDSDETAERWPALLLLLAGGFIQVRCRISARDWTTGRRIEIGLKLSGHVPDGQWELLIDAALCQNGAIEGPGSEKAPGRWQVQLELDEARLVGMGPIVKRWPREGRHNHMQSWILGFETPLPFTIEEPEFIYLSGSSGDDGPQVGQHVQPAETMPAPSQPRQQAEILTVPVQPGSKSGRPKRSKSTTQKLVLAAIALKMQNSEWSEARCAAEAGIPATTLNGHPEWVKWKSKVEMAQASGNIGNVRTEWDRRLGEFVAISSDPE